jgi:hypothetical protein
MERIVELVVRELYERAHLEMSEAHGAVRVATAILGAECVRLVPPQAIPGNAALAWSRRGAAMYIRAGLSPREVNHAAAHELAEWKLQIAGYSGADAEEVAGRIAAALCVPRPAFERARRHIGDSIHALSGCFAVSQSLMALRFGECVGRATALLTTARVKTRGARYDWPATSAAWHALLARPEQAGFTAHRIDDAPGRVALVARRQ